MFANGGKGAGHQDKFTGGESVEPAPIGDDLRGTAGQCFDRLVSAKGINDLRCRAEDFRHFERQDSPIFLDLQHQNDLASNSTNLYPYINTVM